MLIALVVDDEDVARRRVAGLFRLAGWTVREATGVDDAVGQALAEDPDLVVTDVRMPDGDGPTLLRRLRSGGSRAHFLVVTADPSPAVRADAAAAGALATLAEPVGAQVLLDFLARRLTGDQSSAGGPTATGDQGRPEGGAVAAELDAGLVARLQQLYADALPARLSAIGDGVRAGDVGAVAAAAHTLAGTSGQLGHPEVAELCRAIAADARRGVLAHADVVGLRALAGHDAAARGNSGGDQSVPDPANGPDLR